MKKKREKERESPPIVRGGVSQADIGLERERYTVVPEILSRGLHKQSRGRDAKILGSWVGNQICKKLSRVCKNLSSPLCFLKNHYHLSHNHPHTTLFKMTCAKYILTRCKNNLIHCEVLQGFPHVMTAQTMKVTLESLYWDHIHCFWVVQRSAIVQSMMTDKDMEPDKSGGTLHPSFG